jgi:4-amino-4-deoxy-L-arabinose transferase-like glycosyltransferase
LAAIFLVAVLLRLPELLHAGLWRDQANVYVALSAGTFTNFLHLAARIDYHPPLYFVLEYGWAKLFGTGEIAMMALPLLFRVATVGAVYALGRALAGRSTGLVAAGIYAVAPASVVDSGDYVYPVMGFFVTALSLLVLRAREEPLTTRGILLLFVTAVLTVYTHYAALIFIPLLVLWALFSPRGIRHGAKIAAVLAAALCTFAVWLPVFMHQMHVGVPYAGHGSVELRLLFFARTFLDAAPAPGLLLQFMCVLFGAAAAYMVRKEPRIREASALALPFLTLLAYTAGRAVFGERYGFLFLGPLDAFVAYLALQSAALVEARERRFAFAVLGALALFFAAADVRSTLQWSALPRSGMRTFARQRGLDPRSLYVLAPDYLGASFDYYMSGTLRRADAPPNMLGFARLRHAEVYLLDDSVQMWADPRLVDTAMDAIGKRASRYRSIDFVADPSAQLSGEVHYEKAWLLLARLRAHYHLDSITRFPGHEEPIVDYRFSVAGR